MSNIHSFDIFGTEANHSDDQLPILLQIMLFAIAAIFVFVSVDIFITTPSQSKLTEMFLNGFMNDKFFSLLDLLIIFLGLFLIFKYRLNISNATAAERIFFILAIATFVLRMANPNNRSANPVLGLPLFSEISLYSYLFFFGTIICLPKKIFFLIIKRLFTFAFVLAAVRTSYLLLLFVSGKGRSFFFGIRSALLEGDTLLFLGFFQAIAFALFLSLKKKIYFALWAIFLLIQIFSTRRSPLFTALLCNIIVFGFYYVRKMKALNKVVTILVLLTGLFIAPMVLYNVSPKVKVYVDRYLGIFSSNTVDTNAANSDSGHFEQSRETSESALKLGFWGVGYGNKVRLEGAFSINGEQYIHNCFAALWAFHGVYMVIFYLALVLVVLVKILRLSLFRNDELFHFAMIKMSVAVFFILYMHSMYYTTLNFLTSAKMEYILLLLFVFVFKIQNDSFKELQPYFKNEAAESALQEKYYVTF